MSLLSRPTAVVVFLAFAFAYFFSALVRAITATLSPTLTAEFGLHARDLGLLAGGYFLGFALTQLPLGTWLDRYGPKRVVLAFLSVAVAGSLAFSWAGSFAGLLAARVLTGMGVSACLMAPLTGYRRWFTPTTQLRSNSWMLMTGSLGMLASTLPVQWLMPITGWRGLFVGLALMIVLAMVIIGWKIPRWEQPHDAASPSTGGIFTGVLAGYSAVWKHPYFICIAPLGFFAYGGLVAIQTLWAAPWMVKVAGYTPLEAATGLFFLNVCMLCTFWCWGLVTPWLARRGLNADRLITFGLPLSFVVLAAIIFMGSRAGALYWTLYCMSCTFASLSQPAVGLMFAPHLAGRALSGYNLVIFAGTFTVQWGIGLAIDAFKAAGATEPRAFQAAMAAFLVCCLASYAWFVVGKPHNPSS